MTKFTKIIVASIFSSLVRYCLLSFVFLFSFLNVVATGDIYEFLDSSGRKLEAVILQCDSTEVKVERVSDKRRFSLPLDTLSVKDQDYLKETYLNTEECELPQSKLLIPGEVLTLDFPELGEMAEGKPAKCQLSIPKNYDSNRPTPLFVWFSGGSGWHSVESARGMVDFDTFLVLAIPYPDGSRPRSAVNAGKKCVLEISKTYVGAND